MLLSPPLSHPSIHALFFVKFLFLNNLIVFDSLLLFSLIAQLMKNPPAVQEAVVRFLGREDPLEWATPSSVLVLPLWLSW